MFKVTTYFVLRIFLRVLFFKVKLGLFAPNNFHLKWQDTNTNANKCMNLKLMNLRLTNKILYWLPFSTETKNKLWLEEISKVYKSKTCAGLHISCKGNLASTFLKDYPQSDKVLSFYLQIKSVRDIQRHIELL